MDVVSSEIMSRRWSSVVRYDLLMAESESEI